MRGIAIRTIKHMIIAMIMTGIITITTGRICILVRGLQVSRSLA